MANPYVYSSPLCGKHGLKKGLTAFKLPPPTLSLEGRTWLKGQPELGADLWAAFVRLTDLSLVFHPH